MTTRENRRGGPLRVATLPGKLPPGMHLFPPLPAPKLGRAREGLDLGLPHIGTVTFASLAAVAVRLTVMEGAQVPVLLLFAGGQRRPFSVYATKVRAADFGIAGSAHSPPNLRSLILRLAEEAPHLAVDDVTFDFLEGRMLPPIGEKLGDLADAIGLILVNKEPLREARPGGRRGSRRR